MFAQLCSLLHDFYDFFYRSKYLQEVTEFIMFRRTKILELNVLPDFLLVKCIHLQQMGSEKKNSPTV